jgi:uncharacterized protein YacL
LAMFLICLSPLIDGDMGGIISNRTTLMVAAIVFGFKAVLFAWMRHTMISESRRLTVFGLALKDFFLALALLATALAAVYSLLLWISFSHRLPSAEIVIINRAVIVANATLIVVTGAAVAHEMRKAGSRLSVHDESWDGVTDRRTGPKDRRRGILKPHSQ